jgi:hypothetical protein
MVLSRTPYQSLRIESELCELYLSNIQLTVNHRKTWVLCLCVCVSPLGIIPLDSKLLLYKVYISIEWHPLLTMLLFIMFMFIFFFMKGINSLCVHNYGRYIHEVIISIQKSHIKFNVRNYIINWYVMNYINRSKIGWSGVDHIIVFINCCGLFFFFQIFIIILFILYYTRGLTGEAAYSILFSTIKKN